MLAREQQAAVAVKPDRQGVVTIPEEFRQYWDQENFVLEVALREDGVIELRPRLTIDPAQSWFWTERWQRMEREANEDFAAGRFATFDTVESFLADLDSDRAE